MARIRQRAAVLALALVLTGAAAAAALVLHNDPPATARDGLDWNDVVSSGAFKTFARLQRSLAQETITASSMRGFEAVILEPDRLDRIRDLLSQLEGSGRRDVVRRLYAELMRAPSNPDVLYGCLEVDIRRTLRHADEDDLNRGKYYAWALSRSNYAAVLAYEATGQMRFLDMAAETFDRILPYRDSELGRVDVIRERAMNNWGTQRYEPGRYSAGVTIAGRVTFPIVRFCRIVRGDARLTARFGARAEAYLALIEEIIGQYDDEFRRIPDTPQGYYERVARGDVEPLNHMFSTGNTLVLLHALTGREKYLEMATGMAEYFRASMWTDAGGSIVWTYQPSPDDRRGDGPENTWKARTTAHFALIAHRNGIVFDEADMGAIADTFLRNVCRGDGRVSERIGHRFYDMERAGDFGAGYLSMTPFIMFDAYRPEVRRRIEDVIATRPDIGGWLHRTHGTVAYAWRLRESSRLSAIGSRPERNDDWIPAREP